MFTRSLLLALLPLFGGALSAAAEPGFRLAGHTGVATVQPAGPFVVSRGTDDLVFVWTTGAALPRAWRRIEPDADILAQGDRLALLEATRLAWLRLPDLKLLSEEPLVGSVRCRGEDLAWTWTASGRVTLHTDAVSEQMDVQASPGEDASCLLSPMGRLLIWSDETGVKALLASQGGGTLLSANIANDGLVDAGASATAVWASVRSSGGESVVRTTLRGEAPAESVSPGWRSCDTFDAAGQPLPCRTLSEAESARVMRPPVPVWNSARWSGDRILLEGLGGVSPGESEAGWASSTTAETRPAAGRETTVRGRRLGWTPVWMAGCGESGWKVEDRSGSTAIQVAGPICAPAPHWVSLPDDRWAMLQIPGRSSALVWAEGGRPTRLSLPEQSNLNLSMALRTDEGWWVADADAAKAWKQGGGDGPAWADAPVPLLADRTATLSRAGEVLTLTQTDQSEPSVHLLVTSLGTAAWTDAGRWWADEALLPHLVWVGGDGVPYATDDPTVQERFERKLLLRLWDRLADGR